MSKKIDLNFAILTLEGDPVNDTRTVRKDGKPVTENGVEKTEKVPLTLKGMLLTLIPVYPEKERMVFMWDLGLKVKNGEGETDFDTDEFNLLREVIEKNSFPNTIPEPGKDTTDRYFPYIIAQTLKYFDEVSREAEKPQDGGK